MAIGKSMTGQGFKGTARYVLGKEGAEFLYGHGVVGENPDIIAGQMRAVADMRRVKNPVLHVSLSLEPPAVGNEEQWQKATEAFLNEMGFDIKQTQYFVIRHTDRPHDHIHIVANRVQMNNVVVSDFQHKRRTLQATREAEKAAGFPAFSSKKERYVQIDNVRHLIDNAIKIGGGYDKFKIELARVGVEVLENRSITTGRLAGISYKTEHKSFKGSALGKDYGLSGIQKRLDAQLQLGNVNTSPIISEHPSTPQTGGLTLGGGGTNLARNLRKGREGLGLSQGQKDRIRKESSHEL